MRAVELRAGDADLRGRRLDAGAARADDLGGVVERGLRRLDGRLVGAPVELEEDIAFLDEAVQAHIDLGHEARDARRQRDDQRANSSLIRGRRVAAGDDAPGEEQQREEQDDHGQRSNRISALGG